MGIARIKRYLMSKDVGRWVHPKTVLSQQKVAVDGHLYMYRIAQHFRISELATVDEQTRFLAEEMNKLHYFIQSFDSQSLFVFDGFQKPLKQDLIQARLQQRSEKQEQLKVAKERVTESYKKVKKQLPKIDKTKADPKTIQDSEDLIKALDLIAQDTMGEGRDTKESTERLKKAKQEIQKKVKRLPKNVQKSVSKVLSKHSQEKKIIKKGKHNSFSLKAPHFRGVKKSIESLDGICIQAPGDGESHCANLCKISRASLVISDDFDALPFGTPHLVSQVFDSASQGKDKQVFYCGLKDVLAGLDLTYNSFVDLCILCGCDYIDGSPLDGKNTNAVDHLIPSLVTALSTKDKEGEFTSDYLSDETIGPVLRRLTLPAYDVARKHFKSPK